MSAGKLFLTSCSEAQAVTIFRKAPREMFKESELPLYDFTRGYLANYARLPTIQAYHHAGLVLNVHTTEPPAYLLDRLYQRYAYEQVNSRHSALVAAMGNKDLPQVEQLLREMLSGVTITMRANQSVSLHSEMSNVLAQAKIARKHIGLLGASLCWATLDDATNGVGGGELVFIVGRPSAGKSWASLCVAHANHLLGKRVLFVSMEMSRAQIARRWLSLRTGVNPNNIRSGLISLHEEDVLIQQVAETSTAAPVELIAGDLSKDVDGVEALIETFAPEVVVIDAVYLMTPSGRSQGYIKRWEALTAVVHELKKLAIRWDIPIISTVQFNRNQGTNSRKAMALEDIGGTDTIPQDASIVIGMKPWDAPFADVWRKLVVLKNREGNLPSLGIEFSFNPVGFRQLLPEETGQTAPAALNLSWMP